MFVGTKANERALKKLKMEDAFPEGENILNPT